MTAKMLKPTCSTFRIRRVCLDLDVCFCLFVQECSNNGVCDRSMGTCRCFRGFRGDACQRRTYPQSTPLCPDITPPHMPFMSHLILHHHLCPLCPHLILHRHAYFTPRDTVFHTLRMWLCPCVCQSCVSLSLGASGQETPISCLAPLTLPCSFVRVVSEPVQWPRPLSGHGRVGRHLRRPAPEQQQHKIRLRRQQGTHLAKIDSSHLWTQHVFRVQPSRERRGSYPRILHVHHSSVKHVVNHILLWNDVMDPCFSVQRCDGTTFFCGTMS